MIYILRKPEQKEEHVTCIADIMVEKELRPCPTYLNVKI